MRLFLPAVTLALLIFLSTTPGCATAADSNESQGDQKSSQKGTPQKKKTAKAQPKKVLAQKPETKNIRIVTFNAEILTAPRVRAGSLQRFRFDAARTAHFERVAGIIETLNPDVLNLVEVTSKEGVDLLVKMLHEKGMTDYKGYHIESSDGFTGMDVGLITRIAPDKVDGKFIQTIYSKRDDKEQLWSKTFTFEGKDGEELERTTSLSRNSLYYITIAGHKLGFMGLHLKSNPSDAYSNGRRTAETSIVQKVVQEKIVAKGYTPVILGDLNDYDPDVPDRDETRSTVTNVIKDLKNYDAKQKGDELFNVAILITRQADRYTSHWDTNENGAGDSDDVYTMIDHILLPKQFKPYVQRVFIARCLDLSTSDHFPVVVDLKLPIVKPTR